MYYFVPGIKTKESILYTKYNYMFWDLRSLTKVAVDIIPPSNVAAEQSVWASGYNEQIALLRIVLRT